MEKPEDIMMNLAKSMNDSNRSGSNYGKLFLLNEIITILETKKREVKKDIERDSKFPDPYLDKL
tara:strand:- start:509 stop:700 length:192 start_codon:yes stop_codon:yes gene_type:complete